MDPISKPAIMKETNGKQSDISEPDPDDILVYSRMMTRSLFSKQIYSYSDGLAVPDTRNAVRKEFVKKIKAKDLYSSFVDQSTESNHPLVRPIPATISLGSTTESVDEKDKFLGRQLSVVVKDDKKTIVQTKREVGTKSARALLNPWINSIDRKAQALEEIVKPEWHPPWKLYRIICGHGGWVHSLAVDPSNMWLASGCKDGLIKIWDIASGRLRVTLTGHISGVRGLAVSDRHPYLFSCADDKMVKCWDLEQNQVVRHYHGHLSGVYCLAIHPTENLLVTGGRDSVARVWDMRSKEQIHCLTGHNNTVGSVQCLENNPQLITGSYDTTIRLWDMKMGKTLSTMTNHKKSVRSLAINHDKTSFASGATDNIKQWTLPEGKFIQNLSGHDCIINSLATNKFNVLASGADNGSIFLWDWRTGYNFQKILPTVQRGSIESEAGILALTFDRSGARMITGESDKTIKMYREDPNATEDTHPIKWTPDILHKSRF